MKPKDNSSSSLVGEVIAESAQAFFGNRRHIEEMIKSFHFHIKILRKKFETVLNYSALLNFLLVDQSIIDLFYKELDISESIRSQSMDYNDDVIPREKITGWRIYSQYRRALYWVYAGLEISVRDYQYGDLKKRHRPSNDEVMIYYGMALKMCDIINQEIETVNHYQAPSEILGFAGQFSADASMKEQMGGFTPLEHAHRMDQKLSFKPIDFNALNLPKISKLPEPKAAKYGIDKVCNALLKHHTERAKKRIDGIMKKRT